SSFVKAVKKADLEKAATYVVGNPQLTNPSSDSEIADYIFEKTAGSFSYKVEDSDTNEEGTVCTIEIEYSGYSGTELTLKMLLKEKTKGMVDETLKTMERKKATLPLR
ncbi:MAG: hypothetical protein IJY26_03605, partial [Clostridia bacterium]|nr:hypothetical protein [Clostridia bacterium]